MGANSKQGIYLGTTLVGFTSFVAVCTAVAASAWSSPSWSRVAVRLCGRLLQDQSCIAHMN